MKTEELTRFMEIHREIEDSLSSNVRISHSEVLKLVITDLIEKRNSPSNDLKYHFDKVLRYYISEDEFERFVINGEIVS
jgi:hypothetical protein